MGLVQSNKIKIHLYGFGLILSENYILLYTCVIRKQVMERKRSNPEIVDKIGPAHNEVVYEQKESLYSDRK